MKKSLIFGAFAALTLVCALSACNKKDFGPEEKKTINTKIELIDPVMTKAAVDPALAITPEQREYIIGYFAQNADKDLGKAAIEYRNFNVLNVNKDKEKSNDMNELFISGVKYAAFNGNMRDKAISADVKNSMAVFSYKNTHGEGQIMRDKYIVLMIDGEYYIGFDCEFFDKKTKTWSSDDVYNDWILKITEIGEDAPEDDPDDPAVVDGEVEFDVHQQEHKDWKEIKTSIHIRATVDAKIIIPIPVELQAQADDVVVRAGVDYEYISKVVKIGDKTYDIDFEVEHSAEGIVITINTSEATDAIAAAKELYDDGITFEIHTYANNDVEDAVLWNILKETKCIKTTANGDFTEPQACDVRGQITSAFYPDEIKFDVKAGEQE